MIAIPDRRALLRTPAALILGAVILGSSLTACSDSPGDTTCGEYLDMSTAERIDLLDEEIDKNATDEEKKAWEALSDDEKSVASDAGEAACQDADADTKLDDLE